jgi:hypothetical protein
MPQMRRSRTNVLHSQDEQAAVDGASTRICVRESGESRPLEGAAPRRPPSAVRGSGEDAACHHRSTMRESGEDAARLCSYERETEKIMYVLVRCRVWG